MTKPLKVIKCLKKQSKDEETRYNLALAQQKLKQNPPQK